MTECMCVVLKAGEKFGLFIMKNYQESILDLQGTVTPLTSHRQQLHAMMTAHDR